MALGRKTGGRKPGSLNAKTRERLEREQAESAVNEAPAYIEPALGDISIDDLLHKKLLILWRETRNLLSKSAKGKLSREDASCVRDNIKLLLELHVLEQETLDGMSDEQLEALCRRPSSPAPTPSEPPKPAKEDAMPVSQAVVEVTDAALLGTAPPPDAIVVAGGSVTWVNRASDQLTFTSTSGLWDSTTIRPGESYGLTFPPPGVYPYSLTAPNGATLVGIVHVNAPQDTGATEKK